ncbi:MAG: hypothetical protein IPK19_05630 [Chloroflexi bacterium]|nr:hypothetical protein [Chloroflexota bacterium]
MITLPRVTTLTDALWAMLLGVTVGVLCLIDPVIAAAVIVAGVFAVHVLRRPMLVCYTVIAATVFLSGMPRDGLVPVFIPNEPILVLLAGLSWFILMVRRGQVNYRGSFLLALVIFVGGTAIAPTVAYYARGFSLRIGDLFSLIAPVQYLVMVWIFSQIPQTDRERYRILQWMLFCASLVALIGILQAANFTPVSTILAQWYPSRHLNQAANLGRVTSVLGAWNSLGNYLMITLLMILATYRDEQTRLGWVNTITALFLCGFCLLASGSFASIIGLALGAILMKTVFDRRGLKLLLLLVLGFVIGAFLFQENIAERLGYQFGDGSSLLPSTLAYRFVVWQELYFPIIGRNIWWGISPTFEGIISWSWAESQYLFLLVRSGLFSLLAHLAFVVLMLRWLRGGIRQANGLSRSLAITVYIILVALTVMGLTNEVFTSSGAIDYFWILVGLTAGALSRKTLPITQTATAPALVSQREGA